MRVRGRNARAISETFRSFEPRYDFSFGDETILTGDETVMPQNLTINDFEGYSQFYVI